MKGLRRSIIILLVLALLGSGMMGGALASDTRATVHLSTYDASVVKTGTTTIRISFEVTAQGIMDKIGAKYITVQRSSDGTNWTNVITRDSTSYPQYLDEDTSSHGYYFTYYGTKGYYYRVKVMFYASLNTGSETRTGYSNSVKL